MRALQRSLAKRAPSQFSINGESDFYVPYLEKIDGGVTVLTDSFDGLKVVGRLLRDDRYSEPTAILVEDLGEWNLRTLRFYGYCRQQYRSVSSFWLNELTLAPQRTWLKERITQSVYNARLRFRHDRIEVLRRLVDLDLEEAQKANALLHHPNLKSIVQMEVDFYGDRVYGHPQKEAISARFRIIVESLASSGDLTKENMHEFKLNPQALVTLPQYEQDERRHLDSVKQNRRLFWITVATAVAAGIQAYSALFGSLR